MTAKKQNKANDGIEADSTGKDLYYGRILTGFYGQQIKTRVAESIAAFERFDAVGGLAMPYIAAWEEAEKIIWYEYVSPRFVAMLSCSPEEAAVVFRKSVVERRIYSYRDTGQGVREVVLNRDELRGSRHDLRDQVRREGLLEAVYKSVIDNGLKFWIKDQAVVEHYDDDGVCLSFGCLNDVTKEMVAEEELKKARAELKISEEKYRQQAVHDNLTGLYNTRYLYKSLDRLVDQSAATDTPSHSYLWISTISRL